MAEEAAEKGEESRSPAVVLPTHLTVLLDALEQLLVREIAGRGGVGA